VITNVKLMSEAAPMGVVAAQLGHADTRMTEKYYAHLAPNYVAQTIWANFPVLGLTDAPEAIPFRKRSA
jgi:integrase